MADNIDKISRFEQEINKQSGTEIDAILCEARKKAAEIVSEADDKLLEESYRHVSGKTKQIISDSARMVSQKSFEASRETVAHRNGLVDEMFAEIEKEIALWTKTPAYEKKLEKLFAEANSERKLSAETAVYVKPDDAAIAAKLAAKYDAAVKADKTIKLGGISVFYSELGQYVNKTLDDAFQNQKNSFVNNPEMQL